MTCPQCKSNNIVALEEQGNFYLKPVFISKFFITIMILIAVVLIIFRNTNVLFLGYISEKYEIVSVIAIAISIVCLISNIIERERFRKKWIKTSRTKFTCMECGNQWYANPDKQEFFQKK